MNRVSILLVPLLLALPLVGVRAAHADDLAVVQLAPASIAGVVVDATTLQPLSGALVNIQGTNRSALTDPQGRFSITGIEAGTTPNVRVQLIGYATSTTEVPLGSQNVRIALEPSAVALEGFVVSAL